MSFNAQALLFVELSILAYCDQAFAASKAQSIGFTRITQVSILNDQNVTIFSNATDIVIAYRGTYDIKNAEEDINYKLVKDGNLIGNVHAGFLGDFNALWPAVLPTLDTKKQLWATGHSLGGAMAAIAVIRAARRIGPNINGLFTFGLPRIGDSKYVSHFQTPSYRWVNHNDPVPCLPPVQFGYKHFGTQYYINSDQVISTLSPVHDVKSFFGNLFGTAVGSVEDHDIMNYRSAILKLYQESANA